MNAIVFFYTLMICKINYSSLAFISYYYKYVYHDSFNIDNK